jgi:serine protease Do
MESDKMQTTEDRKSARPRHRAGGVIAAAALIGVLAIGTSMVPVGPHGAATADTIPHATGTTTGMMPADFTDVIERVSPAVVNIQVNEKAQGGETAQAMPKGMEEFFKRFFGGNLPPGFSFKFQGPQGQGSPHGGPVVKALGSGFIIDSKGYIVTNNHVAGDASKITVTLQDGTTYSGKLIGKDPETDLALVKIDADRPLPFVKFSGEPTPRPGAWVIAVGNPFGLDHTATAGIVSATGRAIGEGPYDDFIQIDAPINKGNSGGPTFNLKGEVVGVNTAIYSPSGGSVGIGFAIPASIARNVIDQLRGHGHVERGWLGVEIQGVNADMAQSLGLTGPKGAIVAKVMDDGPAKGAGLKQGDVVLSVNGNAIRDAGDLSRRIANLGPGSEAKLDLLRNGETVNVTVKLAKRPEQKKLAENDSGSAEQGGTVLGMQLSNLDNEVRQNFGIDDDVHGAVITEVAPDSAAAEKGLSAGDVIVSVANHRVRTAKEVLHQIDGQKKAGKKAVLMLVHNGKGDRFVALPIGHA